MSSLTVTQLTKHIKHLLETDVLLTQIWVQGEISNFKKATSGHLYMTLKDTGATLRVVMFRSRARNLKIGLEDGLAVRVRGAVSVFEQAGQYQLYAEEILLDGTGALFAALEQLKKKLAAEGLLAPERKKTIPSYPDCIALVTSPTGAVIRDMLNILQRRMPSVKIILAPVAVQGEAAPREVARAVNVLNQLTGIDAIIVGRGGGSLEELWAFNSEIVARAIANSHIPVISAVGHETDFTLADLAADLRAATPSAAAEIAVPDRNELIRHLHTHEKRFYRSLEQKIAYLKQRLKQCAQSRALTKPVATMCDQRRQTLDLWEKQMQRAVLNTWQNKNGQLALAAGQLNTLSPLATLARGYSMAQDAQGIILRQAKQATTGDTVTIYLHQGQLKCLVQEISSSHENYIR